MLQDKSFFKFFWWFMKLTGLVSKANKFERVRALLMVSVLYAFNFVLLIVELYTTKDPEIIIRGIQTFPTFIIILIDALNFERKSIEIEELLNDLGDIVKERNEEQVFETSYRKTVKYVKILGVFAAVSVLLNILIFVLTGETGIPIYLIRHHGIVFFVTWASQSIFTSLVAMTSWLLESNLFLNFSVIVAYSEVLGRSFRELETTREGFKRCFDEHMKFKRFGSFSS
jgi:hypothetical protein